MREVKSFVLGNNIWYARAALNRMLANQLQTIIDPEYRNRGAHTSATRATKAPDIY